MSRVFVETDTLSEIAGAIQYKKQDYSPIKGSDFAEAIRNIPAGGLPTIDLAECMRTGVWPEEYIETFYDEEVGNVESISGQFILENDLHYGMNNNAGVLYLSQLFVGDTISLTYFRSELFGSSIQLNTLSGYIEFSSQSPQFEHHVYNPYVDYFVCTYCVVDTVDTSDGNITAETVLKGYVGYANEERIVGEYEPPIPEYETPSINISSSGLITASANGKSNTKQLTTQAGKTVTPTKAEQTAVSSQRFTTGAVKVGAIPDEYIVPSGSDTKNANGTYDVTSLSQLVVNVPTGTARSQSDLTASGATVTVPAGLYSTQATKSVATATLATPSASKGNVSNHSVTITPTITQSSGYVTGATKNGTPVTVSASELVSGSETKTANGTYDVTNLAQLVVNVAGGGGLPSGFTAIAKGTHTLSSNVQGGQTFTVTHGLGVVPDMFLFYTPTNIATTYSMLSIMRSNKFGWRNTSTYLNKAFYHGNSTTTVTGADCTTSYGIKSLTSTQATITTYSSSTSYYWRAGTYEWIAIKFS